MTHRGHGIRFRPRMQSEISGFTAREKLIWCSWAGVVIDMWSVDCAAGACGRYVSPDARLFILADLTPGGSFELFMDGHSETARHIRPWSMAYIPAGVAIRSRACDLRELIHVDIHIPDAVLARRFGHALDPEKLNTTRLQFEDERLRALAELIVGECANPERLADAYGTGLVDAMLTALFGVAAAKPRTRPRLSRQQLDRSLDYIDSHCFETVRLAELAALLGLSESYFSHAFKASTGMPPSQWQMEVRIGKVKKILPDETLSLAQVAAMAGFADQAHLARSFRRHVGVTPSMWRRGLAL